MASTPYINCNTVLCCSVFNAYFVVSIIRLSIYIINEDVVFRLFANLFRGLRVLFLSSFFSPFFLYAYIQYRTVYKINRVYSIYSLNLLLFFFACGSLIVALFSFLLSLIDPIRTATEYSARQNTTHQISSHHLSSARTASPHRSTIFSLVSCARRRRRAESTWSSRQTTGSAGFATSRRSRRGARISSSRSRRWPSSSARSKNTLRRRTRSSAPAPGPRPPPPKRRPRGSPSLAPASARPSSSRNPRAAALRVPARPAAASDATAAAANECRPEAAAPRNARRRAVRRARRCTARTIIPSLRSPSRRSERRPTSRRLRFSRCSPPPRRFPPPPPATHKRLRPAIFAYCYRASSSIQRLRDWCPTCRCPLSRVSLARAARPHSLRLPRRSARQTRGPRSSLPKATWPMTVCLLSCTVVNTVQYVQFLCGLASTNASFELSSLYE